MLSTLLLAALAATSADASTIIGKPILSIDIDGDTDKLLWNLSFEECVTGDIESFPLRWWLTPGTAVNFTAPEGDWCEVTATIGGPGDAQILGTASSDTLITDSTSSQSVELFLDQSNSAIDMSHL